MKLQFLILLLSVFGCKTKPVKDISEKTEEKVQAETELENLKFFVGDVNNDKVNDTAFIKLKRNTETGEIECGKKNCYINIEFKNNISKISLDQSLGVFISKTEDLNNDNANEILVFSRTHEGWWNNVSVFSFKKGTWNEIAKTKAFISENKDFENRIAKENGHYYLIGENQWEEDSDGEFKKVKIKI